MPRGGAAACMTGVDRREGANATLITDKMQLVHVQPDILSSVIPDKIATLDRTHHTRANKTRARSLMVTHIVVVGWCLLLALTLEFLVLHALLPFGQSDARTKVTSIPAAPNTHAMLVTSAPPRQHSHPSATVGRPL